jgi:Fe2+ transport system protein FeoA
MLSDAASGEKVRIVRVVAGGGLHGRLAAMGLLPGETVEVVHNSAWGPFILNVKGTRIILGRGMARSIEVA